MRLRFPVAEASTMMLLLLMMILTLCNSLPDPAAQQVWDVDRLIRARNPGAVFTTTEREDVTWQTLRSITYSPTLGQGAVGSASVQEASLVRSFKNPYAAKSGGSDVRVNKLVLLSVIVLVINVFWTKLRYSR